MCALHLTHPSAHTLRAVGRQFCGAWGAVGGFGALLKGLTSVVVLKVREHLLFTPPTIPAGAEIRTHNLGLQFQRSIL